MGWPWAAVRRLRGSCLMNRKVNDRGRDEDVGFLGEASLLNTYHFALKTAGGCIRLDSFKVRIRGFDVNGGV
jgi:hypothetical protein